MLHIFLIKISDSCGIHTQGFSETWVYVYKALFYQLVLNNQLEIFSKDFFIYQINA